MNILDKNASLFGNGIWKYVFLYLNVVMGTICLRRPNKKTKRQSAFEQVTNCFLSAIMF